MTVLVRRPGHPLADAQGWVDKEAWRDYERSLPDLDDKSYSFGNEKRKIHVIKDEMEATRHMADGRMYTSKKKFRDATRAHGCIEVGNEVKTLTAPRQFTMPSREQRRDHIRRAIWELKNERSR